MIQFGTQGGQPAVRGLNTGQGKFRVLGQAAGEGFNQPKVGRGLAYADFDRDGDLDLLMTTNNGPAFLYRNDQLAGNHSIRFTLVGTHGLHVSIGLVWILILAGQVMAKGLTAPVTGGTSGLRAIPGISLFGYGPQGQVQHFYLLISVLALAIVVASRIRNSTLGRAMIATKDSEIAAEQSGVDTARAKLLAFMIGAVYAGLAGCLYASSVRFISPDSFSGTQAILLMTMLIVGGPGSITGCVIGAVALTVLPEALRFLGQWYLVLYGLGVIGVIVLAPGGLASIASLRGARAP